MTPLQAFLAERHPEALQRGLTLINGELVEFGTPDNKVLRRLVREHYEAGQEALHDFYTWLVRKEGTKEYHAKLVAATVWNTLCMTYSPEAGASNPMQLIYKDDHTYSYGTKINIAHALKLWAGYTKDSILYEEVILWLRKKPEVTPQYVLDSLEKSPPFTKEEYRRLLKALEEYKGSPRYPWAWPCLRIIFVCGIQPGELMYLEKSKVLAHIEAEYIPLRTRSSGYTKLIPVKLIEEPLRTLLSFPWEWGVVADIVQPNRSERPKQIIGHMPLSTILSKMFKRAKVEYAGNWHARMRWSAAWQYYQKTKNLVGAGQILGMKDMRKVSVFIEELKKRNQKRVEEEPTEDLSESELP